MSFIQHTPRYRIDDPIAKKKTQFPLRSVGRIITVSFEGSALYLSNSTAEPLAVPLNQLATYRSREDQFRKARLFFFFSASCKRSSKKTKLHLERAPRSQSTGTQRDSSVVAVCRPMGPDRNAIAMQANPSAPFVHPLSLARPPVPGNDNHYGE